MTRTLIDYLYPGARWTGTPTMAECPPRRRPLRWSSTAALILALAGFLVSFGDARLSAGYALLISGFVIGSMLQFRGPLKPWGSPEQIDAHDRALRARAYFVALVALGAMAFVGIWAVVIMSASLGWTSAMMRMTLVRLAFLLWTIYFAAPTCYASWTQQSPAS